MSCIAVIPARGGSQRIPRKNVALFHNRPMISYPILTAIASHCFDSVYVSSDDEDILDVAAAFGAKPILRPERLAANEVGTQEVMQHALSVVQCDTACCIYPCTPLLLPGDLQLAKVMLFENGTDYVATVGYPPLRDAGALYFGWADAFRDGLPLFDARTRLMQLPAHRVCDINTPEDWQDALDKYEFMMAQ